MLEERHSSELGQPVWAAGERSENGFLVGARQPDDRPSMQARVIAVVEHPVDDPSLDGERAGRAPRPEPGLALDFEPEPEPDQ